MSVRRRDLFSLVSIFLVCISGYAQTTTVSGVIVDPSGAAVPDAQVMLSGHGVEQTGRFDAAGGYAFLALNHGTG